MISESLNFAEAFCVKETFKTAVDNVYTWQKKLFLVADVSHAGKRNFETPPGDEQQTKFDFHDLI